MFEDFSEVRRSFRFPRSLCREKRNFREIYPSIPDFADMKFLDHFHDTRHDMQMFHVAKLNLV